MIQIYSDGYMLLYQFISYIYIYVYMSNIYIWMIIYGPYYHWTISHGYTIKYPILIMYIQYTILDICIFPYHWQYLFCQSLVYLSLN